MKNYLIVGLLLFFTSCHKEKKNDAKEIPKISHNEYEAEYYNKEKLTKLLIAAIDSNNIDAYYKALKIHVVTNRYNEFLYYSIMMAEKNNLSNAYYDTYYLLTVRINKPSNLAMYYLLKAYEKGSEDAKDEVEDLFTDKKKIPSSCSYLCK